VLLEDLVEVVFSVFYGTSKLISIVATLIYFSTNGVYMLLFPPHACQYLLLLVFLMIAILTGMRENHNAVLICTSFTTKDVEHFFMYWLTIWLLRTVCSAHLPIFKLDYLFFFFHLQSSSLCILDSNTSLDE
jgi:hypothetical protein